MTTHENLVLCELGQPTHDAIKSYSPYCLKIHRALQLHGLSYTSRHANNPAEFSHLHPASRVPILLVDNEPIPESTHILHRLEELSPVSLVPKDPTDAAQAWLWDAFANTTLNGFVTASRWADARNWPRVRHMFFSDAPPVVRWIVPQILQRRIVRGLVARDVWHMGPDHCWTTFQTLLADLETRTPEHGFWCSDTPSVADISIFAQLQSLRTSLTPWQAKQVEQCSKLTAWLARVDQAKPLTSDLALAS